ncbi:acetylornithine transaminase [Ghiorsea bivora]|uniref:acetylornithine transaminase n=1 Tax=Ghiorsea bivora TaxID=1485545 RepID=UPI0005710854|nr:acetylornithine transaminase [Ghiorsea bivora]
MNIQEANQYLAPNYGRFPITLVKGQGARLWDDTGKSYLDFVAGIAVNTLGHAHPAMIKTISKQAATMLHCSNLYFNPQQNELAKQLVELSGLDKVFFCNSGAEANEAAIKIVRKYFHDQGKQKYTIITATQSFHGRTMQTIAATGQDKVKEGFAPLPIGFKHVPLNDFETLEQAIDNHTAAIMLEPLQGEGGVNNVCPHYLADVRKLCDQHDILLIFDEIQTGIARCGAMFAFELAGVSPDILTLAKGLGGGVPIGAMLACKKVAPSLSAGSHGTTFGGNPMSCAAALTVLQVLEQENILENVNQRSKQLQAGLQKLVDTYPFFSEVRGHGLLLGLACEKEVMPIIHACREHGLLVLAAGPHVLRFLPALNITEAEIEEGLTLLNKSIEGLDL